MSRARYLHFGAFRLDRIEGRLWRHAAPIRMSRKAHGLLAHLAEHAGQLVTKEALLTAVWPRAVVVEAVLTTAVREVRRGLDDRTEQPSFVQTVHGRGYRFIAPVIERDDFASSPHAAARLPGRAWEFEQLRQRFAAAFAGERQLVFVAGESGVGKTALVDRFVTRLAAESSFTALHGQCVEHCGIGEAYLPILDALGRLGASDERALLVQLLGRYAPSWLPHLPALHSAPAQPCAVASQVRPPQLLREFAEALDQLAAHRSVVFVLEDLHASDTATLDWLAYAARRRDPARLLVIATYRTEESSTRNPPLRAMVNELQRHAHCTRLILERLSPPAAAGSSQTHDTAEFFRRSGIPTRRLRCRCIAADRRSTRY